MARTLVSLPIWVGRKLAGFAADEPVGIADHVIAAVRQDAVGDEVKVIETAVHGGATGVELQLQGEGSALVNRIDDLLAVLGRGLAGLDLHGGRDGADTGWTELGGAGKL